MGNNFSAERMTLDGLPLGPTIRRYKNNITALVAALILPIVSFIPGFEQLGFVEQIEQLDDSEKSKIAQELDVDKSALSNLIFDLTAKLDQIIFREKFLEERISEIETIRGICEASLDRYESARQGNDVNDADRETGVNRTEEEIKITKLHNDVDFSIPKLNEEANAQLVQLRDDRRKLQEKLEALVVQRNSLADKVSSLREVEEVKKSKEIVSAEAAAESES
jgi:hypothetical protein